MFVPTLITKGGSAGQEHSYLILGIAKEKGNAAKLKSLRQVR
jgi:hypothetical protein